MKFNVILCLILLALVGVFMFIPRLPGEPKMPQIVIDEYSIIDRKCQIEFGEDMENILDYLNESYLSHDTYRVFKDLSEEKLESEDPFSTVWPKNPSQVVDIPDGYQFEFVLDLGDEEFFIESGIVKKLREYYSSIKDLPTMDPKRNLAEVFPFLKGMMPVGVWSSDDSPIIIPFLPGHIDRSVWSCKLLRYELLDVYLQRVEGTKFTFRSMPFLLSLKNEMAGEVVDGRKIIFTGDKQ